MGTRPAQTGEMKMMQFRMLKRLTVMSGAVLMVACAVVPNGPSVMALPGTGRNFEQFRADDYECRQYAHYQIGGKTAGDAARESVVTSAAVGTVVGALAGAAIGGNHQGAAVGAGAGLLMGSAAGSDAARASGYGSQRQYDNAYVQCMYAKGHRVPVPGNMSYSATGGRAQSYTSQDPSIPPPPPGAPPSAPPGARY